MVLLCFGFEHVYVVHIDDVFLLIPVIMVHLYLLRSRIVRSLAVDHKGRHVVVPLKLYERALVQEYPALGKAGVTAAATVMGVVGHIHVLVGP